MNIFKKLLRVSLLSLPFLAFKQDKPVRVVFFGDSITQAAVNPGGYIDKMNGMLATAAKKEQYELIGAGVSGNKVYDLFLRMDDDVLAKQPNVVVVYVGVNDVWHKRLLGTGTDADKFVRFYEAILKKLKANNIRAIVCTPAAIGEKTDYSNDQDGDLNQYSKLIREVAQRNGAAVCDLRQMFLDYNLKNNPENKESNILTTDRVHLNGLGNKMVAESLYKLIVQ